MKDGFFLQNSFPSEIKIIPKIKHQTLMRFNHFPLMFFFQRFRTHRLTSSTTVTPSSHELPTSPSWPSFHVTLKSRLCGHCFRTSWSRRVTHIVAPPLSIPHRHHPRHRTHPVVLCFPFLRCDQVPTSWSCETLSQLCCHFIFVWWKCHICCDFWSIICFLSFV